MSAPAVRGRCRCGVGFRSRVQSRKALDRLRQRAIRLGCPDRLLPTGYWRHAGCGRWHLVGNRTRLPLPPVVASLRRVA